MRTVCSVAGEPFSVVFNDDIDILLYDADGDIVTQLKTTVAENKGNVTLRVKVVDQQADVAVNLYSKTLKVGMTPDMVRFLDDNSLRYTLM